MKSICLVACFLFLFSSSSPQNQSLEVNGNTLKTFTNTTQLSCRGSQTTTTTPSERSLLLWERMQRFVKTSLVLQRNFYRSSHSLTTTTPLLRGPPASIRSSVVARTAISKRQLSTSTPATEGTVKNTAKAKDAESGGIPWGLFVGLGVIGGIIGFFYRGHINTKSRQALRLEIAKQDAIEGDEVEELRRGNKVSKEQFVALAKRATEKFTTELVDADEFFEYCTEQLGGEFALRDGFASTHILERLLYAMSPNGPASKSVLLPLDKLLFVLSLTVHVEPSKDLLRAVFDHFADVQLTEEAARNAAAELPEPKKKEAESDSEGEENLEINPLRMTHARFTQVVSNFYDTCQLPASVRIIEEKKYPYNEFRVASAEDITRKAVTSVLETRKKKKTLKGTEPEDPTLVKDETLWDVEDFVDLMVSKGACVWGSCFTRMRT